MQEIKQEIVYKGRKYGLKKKKKQLVELQSLPKRIRKRKRLFILILGKGTQKHVMQAVYLFSLDNGVGADMDK